MLLLALTACLVTAPVDDAWTAGCNLGTADGYDIGAYEGFLCHDFDDAPPQGIGVDGDPFAEAYVDGYRDCFREAYAAGFDDGNQEREDRDDLNLECV